MGEVARGLDEAWLARAAARDPVAHAYAVWDRVHEADRVRFLSLREGESTVAYLVVWQGTPGLPIVHWVGRTRGVGPLLDALPPRPALFIVPPALAEPVAARRGPTRAYDVELRVLDDAARLDRAPDGVRRIGRADLPALEDLARRCPSPLLEGYRGIDPERTPTFGAFDGDRILGVARASVTLPSVWILTGIVVDPAHRRQGLGRAVTAAATRAAVAAGARPFLYVRSDNAAAIRVYERLGFTLRERRAWLDAGGNREP